MLLHVIGSGSSGNSYLLIASNGETLMLECGVLWQKIKVALKFKLSKVVGCLVTHLHGDHAKSIRDVLNAGIPVYASRGEHVAMNTIMHHHTELLDRGCVTQIGSFEVLPFLIKHDTPEPLGFLVRHEECGTVLFLTDTMYSPFVFDGLNNIIVEANYDWNILRDRLKRGEEPKVVKDRVVRSHMSINTCLRLLSKNDLRAVNNIVLIHLSSRNANAAEFKQRTAASTGKNVHIATSNLIVPLDKTPF